MAKEKKEQNYQEAMLEVELIVKQMENDKLDIDNLMQNIKRATELIKFCKEKLRVTEEELNQIL